MAGVLVTGASLQRPTIKFFVGCRGQPLTVRQDPYTPEQIIAMLRGEDKTILRIAFDERGQII